MFLSGAMFVVWWSFFGEKTWVADKSMAITGYKSVSLVISDGYSFTTILIMTIGKMFVSGQVDTLFQICGSVTTQIL